MVRQIKVKHLSQIGFSPQGCLGSLTSIKKKPKFITKEKERNAMKLENVRSDTHI